jgi:hypothetical protein
MKSGVQYVIEPLFERFGPAAATPQFGIMRTTFPGTTSDPQGVWNESPLGDQFGTLYAWRPHIAGQRQAIMFDLGELQQMIDLSLHYPLQFMELGTQQLLLPGASSDLLCYRLALGAAGAHCTHDDTPSVSAAALPETAPGSSAVVAPSP